MGCVHDTGDIGAIHLGNQIDWELPEPGWCTKCKASLFIQSDVTLTASIKRDFGLTLFIRTSISPSSVMTLWTAVSTSAWF